MLYSLSVTSGKGGVGKTTLSANLAICLRNQGHRVLLIDGDLGVSNLEVVFGVQPRWTFFDLLRGNCEPRDLITQTPLGVSLISGGSGLVELQRLTPHERIAFLDLVAQVEHLFDFLIVDTAPGISDNVLYLANSSQETLVVLTPDPASFTDSYALIKVLNQEFKQTRFSILINQVTSEEEGLQLFRGFEDAVEKFLDVRVINRGSVPRCESFRRMTMKRQLVCNAAPSAESAKIIHAIAKTFISRPERIRDGLQLNWSQTHGISVC